MRLFALLMLLAAACGEDVVGNHDPVECSATWANTGFSECEAACNDATRALNAMGPACEAETENGPFTCMKTFIAEGVTGCCATRSPSVTFVECTLQSP